MQTDKSLSKDKWIMPEMRFTVFLALSIDLPCVQQASCLEGGPLLWIWPLYLHVNQKSDDDDDDDDDGLGFLVLYTRLMIDYFS